MSEIESRRKQQRNNPGKKDIDLKYVYNLEIISVLLSVVVFIYLTWIITQFSQSEEAVLQSLAEKGQIALFLGIIGIIFIPIINDMKYKRTKFDIELGISRDEFTNMFLGIAIGFIAISITNYVIFNSLTIPKYNITGFDLLYFSISMAIVEELFFTVITQVMVEMFFNSSVAGVIGRSFGFMSYHIAVYGEQPEMLISTLIGGFILAISFKLSKRISTNMIIHALINGASIGLSFGGLS